MIIYVSGRYTHGDVTENINRAREITAMLIRDGYDVICPHLNTAGFELYTDITYDRLIEMYLSILGRCDGIYMMSGWEQSNGANIELGYAIHNGIGVTFE